MAVSASRVRIRIQFFFLECKLYLGLLRNKAVSSLEKVMFVLLMTLGWNVHVSRGVVVCSWVNNAQFVVQILVCVSF
jgi:hypothetical protein